MAYKTAIIEKQCIEAIEKNNLMFIEDIVAFVPFSKSTFYIHKLHESDNIKELLETNRIKTKSSIRAKMYKSDNPTLLVALYKLIGTNDEYLRLANARQEIDHTSKGEQIVLNITSKEDKETIERSLK